MVRMLRLEAKRSIALPLMPLLAALTAAYLWLDVQQWSASWAGLVFSLRKTALIALPVALAAGIWHGGRERRSEVGELFAATPRPLRSRSLPALVMISGTVALAQAAVAAGSAVLVGRYATHSDGTWLPALLAGVLCATSVTLLGLGIGRSASAPAAAPLGAVLLFLILVTAGPREGANSSRLLNAMLPILPQTDDFHRVPAALSGAHLLWFTALALNASHPGVRG
jgi:signal transduction histidine kinase